MNPKDRKKERQKRHQRRLRIAKNKRAEKETEKLQKEIEKIQYGCEQIVKSTNEKELERIRLSKTPKNKQEISDIKLYRKQRAKRRNK